MLRWAAIGSMVLGTLALDGAAKAQDGGFYGSVAGMFIIPRDSEMSETEGDVTGSLEVASENGFGLLGAVGYSMPSGLRAELEVGYRGFDFDRLTKATLADSSGSLTENLDISVDGDVKTLSAMANGMYSFEMNEFRPYAGIGVGLAYHQIDITTTLAGVDERGNEITEVIEILENDTVFAYQFMVGVGYSLSDRTEVRMGYRYFATSDADFDGTETTYGSHNFEVGLLFRF